MGVSCTVYSWDKSPGGTGGRKKDCRFEVVKGRVRGTAFPGGEWALKNILAEDPLKVMPGVRIPQSNAEAWVKGLVWFFHQSSEVAAIMDDGSIPPIPTASAQTVSPSEPVAEVKSADDSMGPGAVLRNTVREKALRVESKQARVRPPRKQAEKKGESSSPST
jgi:hypothetical protein